MDDARWSAGGRCRCGVLSLSLSLSLSAWLRPANMRRCRSDNALAARSPVARMALKAGVQSAVQCVAGMNQCVVPKRAEYADDRQQAARQQPQPQLASPQHDADGRRRSSPLLADDWPVSFAHACELAHDEAIEKYLQGAGADAKRLLNAADASGRTGVSHVCSAGHVDLVAMIASDGRCDVNAADNDGNTPLIFAAQAGHDDVVRLLLDLFAGVSVDQQNANGFTALMKAAVQGRAKCAKALLRAGADPTIKDYSRGLSAIEWAALCCRSNCVKNIAQHMLSTRRGTDIVEGLLAPTPSGLYRRKSVGASPSRASDRRNNNEGNTGAQSGTGTPARHKRSADATATAAQAQAETEADLGDDLPGRRNSCQHLSRRRSSARGTGTGTGGGATARKCSARDSGGGGKERKRHSLGAMAEAAGALVPGAGVALRPQTEHQQHSAERSHSVVGASLERVVHVSAVPAAPERTVPAFYPDTLQAAIVSQRRGSDLPPTSLIPKLRVCDTDTDEPLDAAQSAEGPIAMKRRTSSKRRRHSSHTNRDTRF